MPAGTVKVCSLPVEAKLHVTVLPTSAQFDGNAARAADGRAAANRIEITSTGTTRRGPRRPTSPPHSPSATIPGVVVAIIESAPTENDISAR